MGRDEKNGETCYIFPEHVQFHVALDVAICFGVPEMCVDDIPDDGMLTKHNLLYSSLSNNLLSLSTLSLYCHRMQPCASTCHLVAMPKSMGVYI